MFQVRNTVRHHLERWKTIRSLHKSNDSINGRKMIAFCSSINSERSSFFKLPADHKDSTTSNSLLNSSGIMTVLGQPIKPITNQSTNEDQMINNKSTVSSPQPQPTSTPPPPHKPLTISPPSSPTPSSPPPCTLKSSLDDEDNGNHCVTSKLINSNGHNDYNHYCQFNNYTNHNHNYHYNYNNNHDHNHLNHYHYHQNLNHVNNHNNHHSHNYCFHTQHQQLTETINEEII